MHKGLQGNDKHKASGYGIQCAIGRGMTTKLQIARKAMEAHALARRGHIDAAKGIAGIILGYKLEGEAKEFARKCAAVILQICK